VVNSLTTVWSYPATESTQVSYHLRPQNVSVKKPFNLEEATSMRNSEIRAGDWVQAVLGSSIEDGPVKVRPGTLGQVLHVPNDENFLVTIAWEGGAICGADPLEFDVLCDVDFARTPETTPTKPRRTPLKRGAA
jgi:hypothetical protein